MRERPQNIARKLRVIRGHLGVSQNGMTQLLNFKVESGRISDYELGKRQPNLLTLLAYARVAKIPLEQIIDDHMELKFDASA
jgi:transcriptional regulator with XRE-family HTH domain